MLVAAMSLYSAMNMRNNAAMSIMRNNNALNSMISHPSFMGGSVDGATLEALNAMETRMQCENIQNSLQYRMAKAQEEAAKKLLEEETKNSFSILPKHVQKSASKSLCEKGTVNKYLALFNYKKQYLAYSSKNFL